MFETINEDLRNNFYNNPEIASLLVKLEDDILHTRKVPMQLQKKHWRNIMICRTECNLRIISDL